VKAWFDFDNPPQVQYLLPLARRFRDVGHEVILTARDHGDTFAILRNEGVDFVPIGSSFGRGQRRKLAGIGKRTGQLVMYARREAMPVDLVVTGSRAATLAARTLRIPSFVILDYEYVDLLAYALSGSIVLHPSVIDGNAFRRRGSRGLQLISFEGLKEEISFADVDLSAAPAFELGVQASDAPRLLVRPAAEESHYFREESRRFAAAFLHHVARRDFQVVFSPRYPHQAAYVDGIASWRHKPIVLREPVPFVSLLKAVDGVASAGGTMLREAAYLGVPAFSLFQSKIGGVDRHLAEIGRLTILSSVAEFDQIVLRRGVELVPLSNRDDAARRVMDLVVSMLAGCRRRSTW
jgi:uncharacterized protein